MMMNAVMFMVSMNLRFLASWSVGIPGIGRVETTVLQVQMENTFLASSKLKVKNIYLSKI